jgi:sirohydrochlorin cobaltochelatase
MSDQPAILICSHGSRDPRAVEEFGLVAKALTERLPGRLVTSGYLEFAKPTITQSLQELADKGAKEIWAIPGMLFAAMHMKTDIPAELNAFADKNPDIKVRFGRELGLDWRMLEAARERIQQAMAAADAEHGKVDAKDTLLVVVGRGTSDPSANGNIAKVTRMLWDVMGFGWAETGFSGLAYPTADVVMERELSKNSNENGFQRVVAFPYFLFTGILIDRIYDWADATATRHSDVQVVKVPYLKDHPRVIDTFMERLNDIAHDSRGVHDGLAVYRAWKAAGEPLEGEPWMKKKFDHHHHHHHGDGECCGGHGHGHDHGHGHHHHDEEGCCGGHGHEHGHGHKHNDDEGCCGGHGHGHGHHHGHHEDSGCCGGHSHDHGHDHEKKKEGGCGCSH